MRGVIFLIIAALLLIARAFFGELGTALHVSLALSASGFFGFYLWAGFRSGTMEAPGVGHLAGDRTEQPGLFWFCTAFNGMMFGAMALVAAKLAGL